MESERRYKELLQKEAKIKKTLDEYYNTYVMPLIQSGYYTKEQVDKLMTEIQTSLRKGFPKVSLDHSPPIPIPRPKRSRKTRKNKYKKKRKTKSRRVPIKRVSNRSRKGKNLRTRAKRASRK